MDKTVVEMDKIIFKIPEKLKKDFKETCAVVGTDMTSVLLSSVVEFIEESKKNPKK